MIVKALLLFCFCSLSFLQKNDRNYEFKILANNIVDKIPASISVQIQNNSKSKIKLNNLVFDFYIDDEDFWGTYNKTRFLKTDLEVNSNQLFNRTINFQSLAFTSFDRNKSISVIDIKNKMKTAKKIIIKASMTDMLRAENPRESSFLTWSNVIELN